MMWWLEMTALFWMGPYAVHWEVERRLGRPATDNAIDPQAERAKRRRAR